MHEFNGVKDSGKRREFSTGSRRDSDEGKGDFSELPTGPLRRLAKHFQHGAIKYGKGNWLKGQPLSVYYNSAFRHLLSMHEGAMDEDHAAACAWNVFAFMETAQRILDGRLPAELDDLDYVKLRRVEPLKDLQDSAASVDAAQQQIVEVARKVIAEVTHKWDPTKLTYVPLKDGDRS